MADSDSLYHRLFSYAIMIEGLVREFVPDALGADIVVVGQGPGNVGTGTPLGFSGIDQGLAVNAAGSLGGTPVFVPRISFADARDRHRGISHHSMTNLTRIATSSAYFPVPRMAADDLKAVYDSLEALKALETHHAITVDADAALEELDTLGLKVSTMGRGLDQERPFFLAAAAAGLVATQLMETRSRPAFAAEAAQ